MEVTIKISPGELIDRMTILELKLKHFTDSNKKKSCEEQLESLRSIKSSSLTKLSLGTLNELNELVFCLHEVNAQLWKVEDKLRELEKNMEFNSSFIANARRVYKLNDMRHRIKRDIDLLLDSDIMEEKSYDTTDNLDEFADIYED